MHFLLLQRNSSKTNVQASERTGPLLSVFFLIYLFYLLTYLSELFCPKKKEEPERKSDRAAEQKLLQRSSHKGGLMQKKKKNPLWGGFAFGEITKLCSSFCSTVFISTLSLVSFRRDAL